MMTKGQHKIVILTAIGGALEFYDFTIYAFFAAYISHHFFSNPNRIIGLMNTFAVFALGYLARPLGGIVFGHLGDKFGRKSAFSLAAFIMASATLLIGCVPSYQSIGIFAPISLIALRLLQGFSVGGEIPGAAIFTIEHVPANKRGFSIGLVFMCITLGNTLGAGVGLLLTSLLNQDQMMAWGWRIPFIVGLFLGIIGYVVRKRAFETPVFLAMMEEGKLLQRPLLGLLKSSRKQIITGVFLTAVTASIISLFLYLPTYLSTIVQINVSHAYLINLVTFLSFALTTAFFGWGSDYVSRARMLGAGSLCLIVFSYPLFCGLTTTGENYVWVFSFGFAIFGGMVNGSFVVLIAELFPPAQRYTGVGLSYSLGIAIFGGIAPLAFTWLIQILKIAEAPAFYLLGCATLTLTAILMHQLDVRKKSRITKNLTPSIIGDYK